MTSPISLVNVAKYYRDLPHQINALTNLENSLAALPGGLALLQTFATAYRNEPNSAPKPNTEPSHTRLAVIEFSMKLEQSVQLRVGTLIFRSEAQTPMLTVQATSGAPGFQMFAHLWTRQRGPLPNVRGLRISTRRYWSDTVGIEGEWYDILPVFLSNPNNPQQTRSHFGLHRDANAPGSSGCIVVRDSTVFRNRVVPLMDTAYSQGIEDVQLRVIYT